METTTNLKRRRDSGEGAAKKICPEQPKAGPSSQQQKPQTTSSTSTSTPPPLPPPPFPPQILQPTQPLIKLLPFHQNTNIYLEDVTDLIKSPSQGLNLLTGPRP